MEESILADEEETLKAVSIPMPRAAEVYCWPPPQLPVTVVGCCVAPHNTLEGGTHWLPSGQTLQIRWAKGACLLLPVVGRHKCTVPRLLVQCFSWEKQMRLKQSALWKTRPVQARKMSCSAVQLFCTNWSGWLLLSCHKGRIFPYQTIQLREGCRCRLIYWNCTKMITSSSPSAW